MSAKFLSEQLLKSKTVKEKTVVEDWVRPSDWLQLPDITGQQKFVGLHAVFEESNYVSLYATTSAGQYQVDWGDGVIETFDSAVQCYHQYDYTAVSGSPITHNNATYKQVIVTVTPVSGNITGFDLKRKHNASGLTNDYCSGWLDMTISLANCTSLVISSNSSGTVNHGLLEQCTILAHGDTALDNLFRNCYSLQSIPLFNTSAVTTMANMFNTCHGLKTVPLFDTSSVTSMLNMFSNSNRLQSVPLFNTSLVSNMGSMFQNCYSLQSIPLFNTSSVTNITNMLNGCNSLQSVPALNASAVTSITTSFAACRSLSKLEMIGFTVSFSVTGLKLSKTALELLFSNLGIGTSQTLTITTNPGADTAVSKTSCGTTAGSNVVTQSNTSSLAVGMVVTGTGTSLTTPIACTFTDTGDLVNLTAHGLSNGDEVSFATITTTTGIAINTIYYVVNKTNDTFQVSDTLGGLAKALTTNGSGTLRYRAKITAIDTNVSITLDRPCTSTGTNTLSFRNLDTSRALLKGWAITG